MNGQNGTEWKTLPFDLFCYVMKEDPCFTGVDDYTCLRLTGYQELKHISHYERSEHIFLRSVIATFIVQLLDLQTVFCCVPELHFTPAKCFSQASQNL